MPSNMSELPSSVRAKSPENEQFKQLPAGNEPEPASPGPNLKLIYTALAVALLLAIGLAVLIVLPFYHRS
jgi:hypothetical protein